jgi:Na+-driven multidrug efflux pump
VAATALLLWLWDEFPVHAHNIAATGMFVFLALASWWNSRGETKGYRRTYRAIALAMVGALVVILALAATLGDRWDHSILVLEATELTLFAVYWLVQTRDHWRERVRPSAE